MRQTSLVKLSLAALVVTGLAFASLQGLNAAVPQQQQTQAQEAPQQGQDPFPGLLDALKKIDGCLGIEPAETQSGKKVLFVWFEDKAAALRWYESEYHQTMMYRFFPNQDFGEAMEGIAEDSGPIMAIASITPSTDQKIGQLPISQIAIELYGPLKGGLAFGGTFAPAAVQELMKEKEQAVGAGR